MISAHCGRFYLSVNNRFKSIDTLPTDNYYVRNSKYSLGVMNRHKYEHNQADTFRKNKTKHVVPPGDQHLTADSELSAR